MPNEVTTTKSINNVDITPVMKEVIEYSKDQASLGDLEQLISKVPAKDSMDWKLISGVLMNSLVEWVAEDKEDRVELIHRLQSDVGYILKRMGLTM
jgi:ribonuclease D|tara:strand:- start:202 stop:489 length:288 start_codon:yes stop_codon:yes gene_type:complete